MASPFALQFGDIVALWNLLKKYGYTDDEILKINKNPDVLKEMRATMHASDAFRLIHGKFTPLVDKLAMVKRWPGVNPDDVDAALALATKNGTIAGYDAEVADNRHLDAGVTVYRESIHATLVYLRERMRETWGESEYSEWADAYANNVDDDRVQAIPGAKLFVPNRVVIEVVDFGANWDKRNGLKLKDVQAAQPGMLADFAVMANACQSKEWVRQMDGKNVPYAIMAALLLNVPLYGAWSRSPGVWRHDGMAGLHGRHVDYTFRGHAVPVLREYRR